MMRLKDKVALITGGARGNGRAIAISFAKEGADIAVGDVNAEEAAKTCIEIEALSRKALALTMDVTDYTKVEEAVNKILDKFGKVDILVNNAGMAKDNLLLRMTEGEWNDVIATNLKGVFNCTKVFVKAMLKAKKGKIINLSSVIGLTGNAGQANYAASKAGIIGFTKSIAREYASRGIAINVVAPGYIQTEMTEKLPEKSREEILKRIPLGRFGTPHDVAGVCLYLASPEADYITGQTIVVDGGMVM